MENAAELVEDAAPEARPARAVPGADRTMIVRIAELEINTDHIDAYMALLSEEIEASVRLEPGVVFLFAVSIKGSPNMVRVFEGYSDQTAYEAHLNTPHFHK